MNNPLFYIGNYYSSFSVHWHWPLHTAGVPGTTCIPKNSFLGAAGMGTVLHRDSGLGWSFFLCKGDSCDCHSWEKATGLMLSS